MLDVSDRVAVLRKGEYIGCVQTKDANQQSLTDMMVGHAVTLNIDRPTPVNVKPRLDIKGLTVFDEMGVKRLDDVTFTVNAGEVLGIAGSPAPASGSCWSPLRACIPWPPAPSPIIIPIMTSPRSWWA